MTADSAGERPWYADPRAGWILASCLALAFALQVHLASRHASLTWDEPGYIASGYRNWVAGDYRLARDHPPLMQKLQALPLLALDVKEPDLSILRWEEDPTPRVTYGRALFFESGNDPIHLARWARAPVLLLGVLLVLCVYGLGRELMSPAAALLACALAAFDPNLIAHAMLATEDLGCSALMLAAVWSLWHWLGSPGMGRAAAFGALTALALLSKYTALLLLPIELALAVAWHLWTRAPVRWRERARDLVLAAVVALSVINFGYGFGFHLDEYLDGIGRIYPDVNPDYLFYLLGRVSSEPFRSYAVASLAIKTPPPVWLLLVLAAWSVIRSRDARGKSAVLMIPVVLVLGASVFDITAPGVRRILPAVPFVLLMAGLALEGTPGRPVHVVVALAALASAVSALAIHPHPLSYINPLFGGPERGPYLLDESNIDWGQDLPALARWQAEHLSGEPLALFYFGVADPAAYGVRSVPLASSEILAPQPGVKAISAHHLVGFRKMAALRGLDADWLSKYRPIARAGYSILIYRFPESALPDSK